MASLDNEQEDQAVEAQEEENTEAIDKFEPEAPEADTLPQPDLNENEAATLFSKLTIFISREAPKAPLEFILRAFGCKRIAWDAVSGEGAFTHDESDPRITHQIVDRPSLPESALPAIPDEDDSAPKVRPGTRIPGRTYVQPQWVWDCINEGKLLRPDLYAPGATLPPHLSPWVKPSKGEYDPRASLADQEEEGEAERAEEEEDEEEEDDESEEEVEEAVENKNKKGTSRAEESEVEDEEDELDDHGMDVDDSDEEEDSEEEEDEFGGFDEEGEPALESEDEEEAARTQHQKELEAEAAGLPFSGETNGSTKKSKSSSQSKKYATQKKKEEEELERQKVMMSRKKRKLLDKMLYSNKKKDEEAQKLRNKRRKIEKAAKGGA